jgi:hypothetical protein
LPSDPGSEKSGAGSPGFSSTGVVGGCVTRLKTPIAVAAAVVARRRSWGKRYRHVLRSNMPF